MSLCCFKVRNLLQLSGFADAWLFTEYVNVNNVIPVLKRRLQDMYISELRFGVEIGSSLTLYREIKCTFDREDYLQVLENRKFKNAVAKLRLSSHKLFVETGRHRQIPRQDRKCILCNIDDVEDEYHVILICPFYNNIRNTHIPRYVRTRPSMFKFVQLLNETSKQVLVK